MQEEKEKKEVSEYFFNDPEKGERSVNRAEQHQKPEKEVSEYFFNDPEKGERNLDRAEREKHTNPKKRYETEIMRTEGKKR